jgi:crossover junction endodeoxyribonuclease RusA
MPARKPMRTYIQIKPQVKQRPRLGRRGRVYTPEKTLLHEAAIAQAWKKKFGRRKPLEGPVAVSIDFDKHGMWIEVSPTDHKSVLRGDIDNYMKAVLDALNGIAYLDDKQISVLSSTTTAQLWISQEEPDGTEKTDRTSPKR